ncbi:Calx-beta domain-containing protein [Paenibacillus sp. SI8]|uniref:Calx-beta domain-containing protein n=1 Tax=unclassified Paenibacillus TaxID=185978 RepID=UPI0034674FFC
MIISARKKLMLPIMLLVFFLLLLCSLASVAKAESVVLDKVPGGIEDFDSNRILYISSDSVSIKDRNTQQVTSVPFENVTKAYLTSSGAIFVAMNNRRSDLYLWNTGTSPTVIINNVFLTSPKSGNFVAFSSHIGENKAHIWIYNTSNNNYKDVSAENQVSSESFYAAISKDGHLAYKNEQGTIIIYYDGAITNTNLTSADSYTIDEKRLITKTSVYEYDPQLGGKSWKYKFWLYDIQTQTTTILATSEHPVWRFLSNNGWFLFVDTYSVTTRISPTGVITHYSGSEVESLSDSGEIILKGPHNYRYFINSNGEMIKIENMNFAPPFTSFYIMNFNKFENGKWYGTAYGLDLLIEFTPTPAPENIIRIDSRETKIESHSNSTSGFYGRAYLSDNVQLLCSSSNTQVATVSCKFDPETTGLEGTVHTLTQGTAKITVTTSIGTPTVTIDVNIADKPVQGVSLDASELHLYTEGYDAIAQLTAKVQPVDAANPKITWHSTNPKVVEVSNWGYVRALTPGTADIVVTTEDGNYTATCKVTVKGPAPSKGKVMFASSSLLQWVNEDAGTVTANVYRGGGTAGEIAVNYTTVSDTALPNTDFIPVKGQLIFADGETVKSIKIRLVDDTVKEAFKSFSLKLTGPSELLNMPDTNTTFFAIRDND